MTPEEQIAFLSAQVERLSKENERLSAENGRLTAQIEHDNHFGEVAKAHAYMCNQFITASRQMFGEEALAEWGKLAGRFEETGFYFDKSVRKLEDIQNDKY